MNDKVVLNAIQERNQVPFKKDMNIFPNIIS